MKNPVRDKEDRKSLFDEGFGIQPSIHKQDRQVRGAMFEDIDEWITLDSDRDEYPPSSDGNDCGFRIVRNK